MTMRISTLLAVWVTAGVAQASPPPDALVRSLTAKIRQHCPEAQIEVTEQAFIAKSGTMMFTVHNRSKTGEIFPTTHQEEGPNFKGFLLQVSLQDGPYQGAAVIPQTLQGPYFATLIDGPPTERGDQHYWVGFSYGSRLDPDLKQAILDAIPRTNFEPKFRPGQQVK